MIDILWWCLICILLCFGLLGCFINKIPGPIAVVLATIIGAACLDLLDWGVVGIVAGLAVVSIILSKVLVKVAKKLQEYSKRASWGTTIGSILGLCIASPFANSESVVVVILMGIVALIILPFVFAFLLELTNKQGASMAAKCATSATIAYFSDTCLKLVVFGYAVYIMFVH